MFSETQRKSVRLKGYDYSQEGFYFVTINTQNRECLFGNIINSEMVLNEAGRMVEKWYYELENKFQDIKTNEMVVMPNHFHCILQNVGADLCVCLNNNSEHSIFGEKTILGEHIGSPLQRVVQWFKTMTTNEYIRGVKSLGWEPFNKKLWQRNYYEHIIRNEASFEKIGSYILNNPAIWEKDQFYISAL